MIKLIRIMEVPLLFLILAFGCIEEGAMLTAIFLLVISVTRLIVNVITDDTIYKY